MIVPADYQKLDPLPEDPEGCVTYGKQTENALCMVSIFSVDPEDAMDFNDNKALIDGIHHTLAENQALIEVENGRRTSGYPYILSFFFVPSQLVRSSLEPPPPPPTLTPPFPPAASNKNKPLCGI